MNNSVRCTLSCRNRCCWIAFVALFAALQFSLARQETHGPLFARAPRDYYSYMTDAVLSGHLWLNITPRPELLKLADPYDPTVNSPYRLTDLSLYHGRYYAYWGLSPVVLLFAPWFLLTKTYLSEALAAAVLTVGAQMCFSWLLLSCRQTFFPKVGWIITGLVLACVGISTLMPVLAMNDTVSVAPIACAAFCQAFVFVSIYRALCSPRPIWWTIAAGVGIAFTLGSRPNYLLWAPCFLVPLCALWKLNPRTKISLTLAAIIPPALGLGAILAVNWARFHNFRDFGLSYALTPFRMPQVEISWSNLWRNLSVYGWSLPTWSRYFPFISLTSTVGLLIIAPAASAVLALPLGRRFVAVRAVGWTMALAGFGGMVAMSALPWVAQRYAVDFSPASLMAASFGALALAEWSSENKKILAQLGLGLVFAGSSIAAALLMLGLSRYDRLRPIGRIINAPVFAFERMTGKEHGAVLVRFKLPHNRVGAFEPLLSMGAVERQSEVIFITYDDEQHARLGFFQTATTHWISQPIALNYNQPHELNAAIGALMPPDSDPVFTRWRASDREATQQVVTLFMDGHLVYKSSLDFGIRRGEQFQLGVNNLAAGVSQPRFTGQILDSRVKPLSSNGPRPNPNEYPDQKQFGAWRIVGLFPAIPAKGWRDPLLVSGVPGAADFIYVFYPEAGKVAFGHDSWSYGGTVSQTVSVDVSRPHQIDVSYGGLFPVAASLNSETNASTSTQMKGRLRISLDGIIVMETNEHTYDASPDTVTPGENRIGGSTTAPVFSGHILSAQRVGDEANLPNLK